MDNLSSPNLGNTDTAVSALKIHLAAQECDGDADAEEEHNGYYPDYNLPRFVLSLDVAVVELHKVGLFLSGCEVLKFKICNLVLIWYYHNNYVLSSFDIEPNSLLLAVIVDHTGNVLRGKARADLELNVDSPFDPDEHPRSFFEDPGSKFNRVGAGVVLRARLVLRVSQCVDFEELGLGRRSQNEIIRVGPAGLLVHLSTRRVVQ